MARDGKASTSRLQPNRAIGNNKPARLAEPMKAEPTVGPASPTGKPEISARRPHDEDLDSGQGKKDQGSALDPLGPAAPDPNHNTFAVASVR